MVNCTGNLKHYTTASKRLRNTEMFRRIDNTPAVAIVGAHQGGKTTMANLVPINQNSIYLDLGFEEG